MGVNSDKGVQRIAILGSTGSIGKQAVEILRSWPERMEATVLAANNNWQTLAEQARELMPDSVIIGNKEYYPLLKEALKELPIKVYAGPEAIEQIAANTEIDTVLNALVGYAGLRPALAAVKAGKKLALANKESLVAAGSVVIREALENRAPIIPVDSEHSAIFQCLMGEPSPLRRVILTASGGPFRKLCAGELEHVTVEQALAHPNWNMGAKITIDSATMLNKGFEVIEAHHLFGIGAERIEVLVHPTSIVHSMVEFEDGAIKAQLGVPDMRLPIQLALTFPHRLPVVGENFLSLKQLACLQFEEADPKRFPCLGLAYEAMKRGGNSGCVLVSAGEEAVRAFLEGKIGFTKIAASIEYALEKTPFIPSPTLEDIETTNIESRKIITALWK